MEMLDEEPMYDRFLRTLGQAGTLVVFDKPGVGASVRSPATVTTSTNWLRRSWRCSMRLRHLPDGCAAP